MRGAALFLAAVFAAGTVPALAAEPPAGTVEEKDTNGDGKVDEWRTYDGHGMVRIQRDRDGDGKPEGTIYLEAGIPVRAEADRNNDGKPDMIRFYEHGKPARESLDTNFDGKWDAWVYYVNGVKNLLIRDRNFDGKPDAWFYYDETGTRVVGTKSDENSDGVPDKSTGTVPEKETRQPW